MIDINKETKQTAIPDADKKGNFDDWLNDLEDKEQPESCTIDDPDCEACGS